eukprot:CAMPEP_0206150698 /NCGR_PEP_ID=MMETSP1473-20131121/38434_1 /ASSEMBLY_ACC=CAM_ASM_001109 /TAXON_ID=1461547 /ORGANISM="Stichococcus sp, Strain RCC1054" /LENGTH=156 /DNA_ID=CAMNT_0053548209 /DNA_START=2561 /DNA_END=3032 /DNA_ORIENTATION=-
MDRRRGLTHGADVASAAAADAGVTGILGKSEGAGSDDLEILAPDAAAKHLWLACLLVPMNCPVLASAAEGADELVGCCISVPFLAGSRTHLLLERGAATEVRVCCDALLAAWMTPEKCLQKVPAGMGRGDQLCPDDTRLQRRLPSAAEQHGVRLQL